MSWSAHRPPDVEVAQRRPLVAEPVLLEHAARRRVLGHDVRLHAVQADRPRVRERAARPRRSRARGRSRRGRPRSRGRRSGSRRGRSGSARRSRPARRRRRRRTAAGCPRRARRPRLRSAARWPVEREEPLRVDRLAGEEVLAVALAQARASPRRPSGPARAARIGRTACPLASRRMREELARIVGADHVTAADGGRARGRQHRVAGVRARDDALLVAARPTPRRSPRSSRGATSASVPIVPRGGGTGLRRRRGAARASGSVVLVARPADGACARSTRCCGGWRSRPACAPPTSRAWRARTACCTRPTPARPSRRRSAATSRRTPAARTRSSTASPARGSPASRRSSRRASSCASAVRSRKDVAGYDLLRRCSSAARGRSASSRACGCGCMPAPEAALPVVALYPDVAAGARGDRAGARPAASSPPPSSTSTRASSRPRAARSRSSGSSPGSCSCSRPTAPPRRPSAGATSCSRRRATAPSRCTRRRRPRTCARSGTGAPASRTRSPRRRGGKLSEDVAVPLDRLAEAIEETLAIGERHGLEACSWGHAGDGNLHSTFLLDPGDDEQLGRAARGRRGPLRAGDRARRHGQRRARRRPAEERPAPPPVGARPRSALHRGGQARARPEGPVQPREEAPLGAARSG